MIPKRVLLSSDNRDISQFPDSSKYRLNLGENLRNVTEIHLLSGTIPNTVYNINKYSKTLELTNGTEKYYAVLPEGVYSVGESVNPLNSVTESVLVLRLLRLLRLLRIISFIPELQTIVENLAVSLRKSVYILLLIFIITYIYAVVGTTYFADIPNAQFKTLGESMITLVQVATMSSWENVLAPVSEALPMSWLYFVSYIFICGIVVLNLFVALLVDVVAAQRIENKKND